MAKAALFEALGGVLVVVGLALAWPPLGFLSAGLALIAVGYLLSGPSSRDPGSGSEGRT